MIDERWQILQTELLLTEVQIRSILRAESQVVLRIPITSVVAKPHIVALLSENTLIASISAYLIVEVQHVLATLFQADFERKCGLGL